MNVKGSKKRKLILRALTYKLEQLERFKEIAENGQYGCIFHHDNVNIAFISKEIEAHRNLIDELMTT